MRENSPLEANSIFRDKDRKMLKLPQLRRLGIKKVADVVTDDGGLTERPDSCATNLATAMEWQAIRKYFWPTFQRLCYDPQSNLEIVRREPTLLLGAKALTKRELTYQKIVLAIRNCPPPSTPRWTKAEQMLGSTSIIGHAKMKRWAIDTRTRDFVFEALSLMSPTRNFDCLTGKNSERARRSEPPPPKDRGV
jgi:hypothetical protein